MDTNVSLLSGPAVSPLWERFGVWDVVLCASGTLIVCENALVVWAVLQTPSRRAPALLLMCSLAWADLLAGLGLVLRFVSRCCNGTEGVTLCAAGLLVSSFSASVCSLLGVALDRYLSLRDALTYRSGRTLARTRLALVLVWTGAVSLGLLPVLGWNCLRMVGVCSVLQPLTRTHVWLLCVALLVAFAIMLQLYARISNVARRHAHQIALQRHLLPAHASVAARRGTQTLALVLGTFAGCWLPFAVYGLLADASYPPLYTYATLLPAAYNSLLNPLIYAFRNHDIQKVLLAACCLSSRHSCHAHSPSDV